MPGAMYDTPPSRFGSYGRIALALAHAAVDSEAQQQAIAFGLKARDETAGVTTVVNYVEELIKGSSQAWSDYIEHPFPKQLANDTALLNGFRHYMIQDSLYLEHYYRLRTQAVGNTGTFDEIKKVAAKLAKSLDFVTSSRGDLTNKLGVPQSDVTGEAESKALLNSIALHEEVLKTGDWLDIHIVLLPCILGYDTIATKLLYDPQTIRNTIYYPLWIQATVGGSSPKDYKDFINKNITPDKWAQKREVWIKNFTSACKTEAAFFDLGLPSNTNIPVYKIVKDGKYKIRSYRNNNLLVTKSDSSVTTEKSPGDVWSLTNTRDGYIVERVGNEKYLVYVEDSARPLYEVKVSGEKQYWPINTVVYYDNKGSHQSFQIYLPGRTGFALDAGRNVDGAKVFVTDNSQISSQLWLLEAV